MKIKAHILCFLQKSYRPQDKVEKYGTTRQATDDNIIRPMRFACGIRKATEKHSEYVILTALPLQQCLHERATMLRHSYLACLCFCLLYREPCCKQGSRRKIFKVSVHASHNAYRLRHKDGLIHLKM